MISSKQEFEPELIASLTCINSLTEAIESQRDEVTYPIWTDEEKTALSENLKRSEAALISENDKQLELLGSLKLKHGPRKTKALLAAHQERVREILDARAAIRAASLKLPEATINELHSEAIDCLLSLTRLAKSGELLAIKSLRNLSLFAENELHKLSVAADTVDLVRSVAKESDRWPFRISMMRDSLKKAANTSNPDAYAKYIMLGEAAGLRLDSAKPRGSVVEFALNVRKSVLEDIAAYGQMTDEAILASRHIFWKFKLGEQPDAKRVGLQRLLLSYVRAAQELMAKQFTNPSKYADEWANVGIMMGQIHTEGNIGRVGTWPAVIYRETKKSRTIEAKLKARMREGFYQLHGAS